MLNRIEIRNFQSLVHVDLDLAPLTVIVGPSSSGKSAFIRSMRALHENRRGTAFITHGERVASISAHLEQGIVTLTRSTQTAPNHYTVIPSDPAHPLYPKAEFSKLGGDVPSEVSEFLGIAPDEVPLSIASQFDKPYLLEPSQARIQPDTEDALGRSRSHPRAHSGVPGTEGSARGPRPRRTAHRTRQDRPGAHRVDHQAHRHHRDRRIASTGPTRPARGSSGSPEHRCPHHTLRRRTQAAERIHACHPARVFLVT
jgi:energy-coupling factor transporter ATP-binding protein EcfA2